MVFFKFFKIKKYFILFYYIKTNTMANILELIQRNDMLKVALILLGVYFLVSYMQKPKSEKMMQNYYGFYLMLL